MTSSIRAVINNSTETLEILTANPDRDDFSIRRFIHDAPRGNLFIASMPKHRESLSGLISAWSDIVLTSLMDRDPDQTNGKLWLIIDELTAAGKIPSLKTALAESRKYGGCVMAGIQNISQLRATYGNDGSADNLLDLFGTRFVFRVSNYETARITAAMLGSREVSEKKESFSYGADTRRDGVNISNFDRTSDNVIPGELMDLPDLHCYVRPCGNYPTTKLIT